MTRTDIPPGRPDFTTQRLFTEAALNAGAEIALDRAQANYTLNVLRMREGAALLLFNGRDGEWRATLRAEGRKAASLLVDMQTRPQPAPSGPELLFAPLKHARLDYMVQKAVEMGAARLRPVITARTQVTRVNLDRMRANAIEAAEQCGVLAVPDVLPELRLGAVLADWPAGRTLIFCDEAADPGAQSAALAALAGRPLSVLIGPEGGFDADERRQLLAVKSCLRLSLGPRILRADTAAVAALAFVQALAGDWR